MGDKFIIYVLDEVIKIYISSRKRFTFQGQYKVTDPVEIDKLCKFLEKKSKTPLYIYLDTSEVSFEHRLFSRDASRSDVVMAIKCYLESSSNIISGASKLYKIESEDETKRKPPRVHNIDAKTDQNHEKANEKERHNRENAVQESLSMGRSQYIMFSINDSCEVDGLKEFLKFVTIGINKVRIIDFFQMNLIRSNLASTSTNVVTITVKINEDGRITIVASYGKNFIVNRDDSFDKDEIKFIQDDILSTIKYIETILTFEVTYVINILTGIQLTKEDIFPNGQPFGSVLNIMTPDHILRTLNRISISSWSDSQLDDAVLAMIYTTGSHSHFMTNSEINKKRFFFRIIPMTYLVIGAFLFSLVIFDAKDIFVNTRKSLKDLGKMQIELNQVRKDYEMISKESIDRKLFKEMKACVAIDDFSVHGSKYMNMIKVANAVFNKRKYVVVRDYMLECTKDCRLPNGTMSLRINLTIFNKSGYFEDMQSLYKRLDKAIREEFNHYYVTMSSFSAKLDSYKTYDSQDLTISITTM